MNLSIYLCAPSELVEPTRRWAAHFRRVGVNVTSRWLQVENLDLKQYNADQLQSFCLDDLDDIKRANMFVAINPLDWAFKGTGGRHVELGYALAHSKPVVLYGDKTNVFHNHPEVFHVEDPGDLVKKVIARWQDIQP